ncbi:hypothetical protein SAMN05443633_11422 [Chryseobacterium arachidis]|uniref:Uncharacterized protein n=1 Tax=Chryseobacterium arachidis TaxID=1416778 RepID=A0A1M5J796_9FLAO|nr:hypothetical protein [Chryseobacterium arachidis]SHG36110.1 hypothetical protein SAMN05443633_11422 [Chryseobacterium arachidis]
MKTADEILEINSKEKNLTSINLLSKEFAPNESSVAEINISKLNNTFGTLIIQNSNGQSAEFSWQKNVLSSNTETGYFKEIRNDLGIVVHYNENSITVINGGVKQFLVVNLEM